MGKCVSKHPSAITIASAEYLTSNNKIFIEKYPDNITIKNKNTNSDNSIYIPRTPTTTTTATFPARQNNAEEYYKNDKNLCNNTILIEDSKNKIFKTKKQKQQHQRQQNKHNNNNSISNENKNGKKRISTKNSRTTDIIVANRNIVKTLTTQISKFTTTTNTINATTIKTYNADDDAIDCRNKENVYDNIDIYLVPVTATSDTAQKPSKKTTKTTTISNFEKTKKRYDNQQVNNITDIKDNNNIQNNGIDISISDDDTTATADAIYNDDDYNQGKNRNHDVVTFIKNTNNSTKRLTKNTWSKKKNNRKCQENRNCRNKNISSKNSNSSNIGNSSGNSSSGFSTKKISCLSKNESQDSLNSDEILKSLNTKKLYCNNNEKNKNNNQKDNENGREQQLNKFEVEDNKEDEVKEYLILKNNCGRNNEGQTESKKKSKNIGPDTKGTAMSFGFRKKLNNTPKKQKFLKDNCNNSAGIVGTDETIITNPVLDDLNNFNDKNGNSDITDATSTTTTITNATAKQQKYNSTKKNACDKTETTWATHRTANQLSQNKEHHSFSLMGGGNGNGSGGGGNGNTRNRFGFRSSNTIRPASTGFTPSNMTELQENQINNNNNCNGVTVKRRSKSASAVSSSSSRDSSNSYNIDDENNRKNSGNEGVSNVAAGNITTKRSTLVNRNSDQQQQQKVVNEVRFAENPKINYITSIHDMDDEYNSRPHWKHQGDIRRSGGMTSEMLRNQFFSSGCTGPSPSLGMMNRHGNMMNQHQIITTGMHTNVILKPKPIMTATATSTPSPCKFTLHTASLPKPQYPVPISLTTTAPTTMDSKSAKQMANNNRKGVFGPRDISTDSGLSSMDNTNDNSNASRSSVLRPLSSSSASASASNGVASNGSGSPKKPSKNRPRNLEMVISGRHKFEVRDLDALSSCENVEPLALPKLPSIFSSENQPLAPLSGLVRSNTILSRDSASTTQESTPEDMRKTSRTNSESDSINEEKLFRDRSTAEKDTNKNSIIGCNSSKNSSPASSRASWCQAGESLAIKDCSSLSISSSDDSKDIRLGKTFTIQTEEISSITFDERPSILSSLTDSIAIFPKIALPKEYASNNNDENIVDNKYDFSLDRDQEFRQTRQQQQQPERPKSMTKDVDDPLKFAEFAAAVGDILLDDETSPTDSLVSSTESEEAMLKKNKKKTNEELPEKDIDEISPELDAFSPLSPGTPTHASNSLSLSDIGKDFLIDDEIADQPALLFSDKKNDPIESGQHTNSITDTTTLMESAAAAASGNVNSQRSAKSNSKSRNLMQAAIELSLRTPISLRKATMLSKAESWDTLSPCESIASDDLMMDFETSSMDSIDRVPQSIKGLNASALKAFDDAELLAEFESKGDEMIREWNNILRVHRTGKDSIISHLPARATRLLNRSRLQQQTQLGSTAGSDSPKSNDSFNINRKQTASSRSSSIHLSNREINSSSDDLLLYDKSFRNSMIQDVLYFKKQLLRLRRILQEDEENLQRTDTLNPFEVNNGQFFASPIHGTTTATTAHGNNNNQSTNINNNNHKTSSLINNIGGSGNSISSNHSDLLAQQYCGSDNEKINFANSLQSLTSLDDPIQELADLRRQVVYLQSQVDDRERTIRFQNNIIEKLENENERSRQTSISPSSGILEKEVVNTATQTERVRPLSIGQEGLSRSKPEYTSYTINLPKSGSSATTTTTEIISPSVTSINFLNSKHNPSARRHTVISTTFTNLNHTTPTQNLFNSPRRASIPWEKLIYKPVKTTLIGEPISLSTTTTTTTAMKTPTTPTSMSNGNNDKNSYLSSPTVLKTTTTIFSSQIDKNNKNNLLSNGNSEEYQSKINSKITGNSYNNGIENGKYNCQQQKSSYNLPLSKNSNLTNNIMNTSSGMANILNKCYKKNGEHNGKEIIANVDRSNNNHNVNNHNNGIKCNSENHNMNGSNNNSKLFNHKYNVLKNGSNYINKNNKNCFDVIVTQTNTNNINKTTTTNNNNSNNNNTNNNGSVTTIV